MFRLSSGEKKFVAIIAIIGVVFVAVVAGGVFALTSGHEEEAPYLQATTGKTLVKVQPTILCDIDLSNCRKGAEGTFARELPVPVGEQAIISVSQGIADAPWALTIEYLTPKGFEQEPPVFYAPNERFTFTVSSTKDKIVSNVEVRLPSGRTDAGGAPITRGFWSLKTLPPNTPMPREAQSTGAGAGDSYQNTIGS
ncbi:MAG: DUF2771 family protein [Corynebacteriales bacterium]|uniref:DUF2771 domain-containing protein n=1 Tax=Williamsia herbipolensis TaxID=1603258 RepID=A0AAU4K0Y3_9NOCA|nr:DUF2771 family protein [Williamsia herbipolensis]MCX6467854.1 DUF2771 family protein [Mycobacteriales bacterium]